MLDYQSSSFSGLKAHLISFLFSHFPSVSPISSTSTHLSNQNIYHHLHSHNPSLRHLQSKQLQCFLIGLHVSTFDTVSISSSHRAASRISLKHITRFLKMLQYCPWLQILYNTNSLSWFRRLYITWFWLTSWFLFCLCICRVFVYNTKTFHVLLFAVFLCHCILGKCLENGIWLDFILLFLNSSC